MAKEFPYLLETIQPHQWMEYLPLAIDEFVIGEPITKGIKATPEEFYSMLKEGVRDWIGEGISVCARDVRSGKAVGLLVATTVKKGKNQSMWSELTPSNEKTRIYIELEKIMENAIKFFEEDPHLEMALEQNLLVVSKEHCGKGIGSLLAKKTEEIAMKKGCQIAIVEASGVVSQRIFSKLGYETKFEFFYQDFEVDGKKVFDLLLMGGTTKNTIMVKNLVKK